MCEGFLDVGVRGLSFGEWGLEGEIVDVGDLLDGGGGGMDIVFSKLRRMDWMDVNELNVDM